MAFGELLSKLFMQIGPTYTGPQEPLYKCHGYLDDSKALETVNKIIKGNLEGGADPKNYYPLRDEIQKCLSNIGNVIAGGSANEPNIALYIGIGAGITVGIGGLAWYLKSRSKKSEKTSQ